MAITSAEIHNQSFSIDRKGYDVDEVDVFLEHVADEIDNLNNQIADLQDQLNDSRFAKENTCVIASAIVRSSEFGNIASRAPVSLAMT